MRSGWKASAFGALILLAIGFPAVAEASVQASASRSLQRELGPQGVVDFDRASEVPRVITRVGGFLTPRQEGDLAGVVREYVGAHRPIFRLDDDDISNLQLARQVRMRDDVFRLVFVQTVSGVPILGGGIVANVTGDGQVIGVFGPAIPDLQVPTAVPDLSAAEALGAARDAIGASAGDASEGSFPRPRFASGRSTQLVVDASAGQPQLAWRILLRDRSAGVSEVVIDAETGETRSERPLSSPAVSANVFDYYPGAPSGGDYAARDITPWVANPGGDQLFGDFAYAFSDVNSDEFVEPQEDALLHGGDGDDYLHPYHFFDLGAAGNCPPSPYDCSWDTAEPFSWTENMDRAAVQLFYQANRFHDHLHASPIEFTAEKGAFEGESRIWLSANDGANTATGIHEGLPDRQHLNNAFFSPNPGGSPMIVMFLFGPDTYLLGGNALQPEMPTVNGADDGSLVFHEYSHGLTTTLISDAQGLDTLGSHQARSMNEAWSDWYAMDFVVGNGNETDTAAPGEIEFSTYAPGGRFQALDCPVGAPAAQCPAAGQAGAGGFTYGDIGRIYDAPETHADGEIWAQTLWDLRRRLIAAHGAVDGAETARLLITAAMELSPPEPTFLDQRNAILQADFLFNEEEDSGSIWEVFAARGMGYFASTIEGWDVHPSEDFSLPPAEAGVGGLAGAVETQLGAPVAGAPVSVGGFSSVYFDTTDASGSYEIVGIPVGTYPQVTVGSQPGYDGAVEHDVQISNGGIATRNISLQRNWAAAGGGASISAQEGASLPGCPGAAAIDQDYTYGWGTDSPTSPEHPGSKSLTVRLPRAVDVTSLAVNPSSSGCFLGYSASLGDFRIDASANGTDFVPVDEGTFTAADLNRPNAVTLDGGPTTGTRYIRIVGLSTLGSTPPLAGATKMSLTEVQIYGNPALAPCDRWASPAGNNANPGTEAQPYRSVAHLTTSLGAGETGCLASGAIFNEPVGTFIVGSSNGTAGSPVTVRSADPADPATVRGQMWLQSSAHDIAFESIRFDECAPTCGIGSSMMIVDANRVTLRDNEITFRRGICVNVGTASQSLPAGDPSDIKVTGFRFEGNRLHHCGNSEEVEENYAQNPGHSGIHGLYVVNASGAVIEHNYFYENVNRGIQLYPDVDGSVIKNNVIDGNGSALHVSTAPDNPNTGVNEQRLSEGNLIEDNILSNSDLRTTDPGNWPNWPAGDHDQVNGFGFPGPPRGPNDAPTHGNLITRNCVYQPVGANFAGWGYAQTENLFVDPQYVNRAVANFSLQPGSPCAGKGPIAGEPPAAECQGQPVTIPGTAATETIPGTPGDDVIGAGDGDDTVNGMGGEDTICGGGGDDTLNGGADADSLSGEGGFDSGDGGSGLDTFDLERVDYSSATGPMEIDLDIGLAKGPDGTEFTYPAHDAIGSPFDDKIFALPIGSTIAGGNGDDRLFGGPVADLLLGGAGFDTMSGGSGDDDLDGQGGGDAAEYGGAPSPVNADLGAGVATGEGADTLISITDVYGSPFDDHLTGSDVGGGQVELLYGAGGNDALDGRGGSDLLNGHTGNDLVVGGGGSDDLRGGLGADTLRAQDGEIDQVSCGGDADPKALVDALDSVSECEQVEDLGHVDPPPPPPPPIGRARVAAVAQVQRGVALLKMHCVGLGNCRGAVQLVVRVGSASRRVKPLSRVIGEADYAIPAAGAMTVRVRLTRAGLGLVRRAGRRGVAASLVGSGLGDRSVKLKMPARGSR